MGGMGSRGIMRAMEMLKMLVLAGGIALAGVAVASAEEPTPAPGAIVAGKGVTGTGKRADPFVFDSSTKCVLRLMGARGDVQWDLEDSPSDAEVIGGGVLVFSLAEPGDYVVWAAWSDGRAKAWFRIKGANGPPEPVDQIVRRVRDSFTGSDAKADAIKFRAACEGLSAALEAGQITKLGQMEDALKAGLDANGWKQGKYPDLSRLCGELWGAGVPDGPIDSATREKFVAQLKTMGKACEGVK